jgi:hypothetical protein
LNERTLIVSAPGRLLQEDSPQTWGEASERETVTLVIEYPDGVAEPAERDPRILAALASHTRPSME